MSRPIWMFLTALSARMSKKCLKYDCVFLFSFAFVRRPDSCCAPLFTKIKYIVRQIASVNEGLLTFFKSVIVFVFVLVKPVCLSFKIASSF